MRIVFFHPQERVDVPDLTAVSFLTLGEFRRVNRALILGEDRNAIIRGYAVEPAAVPSALVYVKLQDGADPLSIAMLSEAMGGAGTAYGQLVGDRNDDDDLEGNAQQTLDFTGQPVASYTVQARFTFGSGAMDNRAFWDDGTDTETVSNVATRHLPTMELRFSGTASDEWIDLATVAWDGTSIDAADITDLRVFMMEGGPASTAFRQATQTGTGGMPDFSRSADRAANGINTLVPFMKGLARQIQDIKGQDDSGYFNWWSRVVSPMDPADTLGGQTKSLRTIDQVTYTIGDGATDFGDFNTITGLHTCLTLIAAQLANLPNRITIMLKSRSLGTPTWALTGTYALGDKRIRIIGGDGSGTLGRAHILCSTTAASNVLSFTTNGGIELENLHFATPTNEVTMFSLPVANGRFAARNCAFYNVSSRTRAYADIPSSSTVIEGCVLGSFISGGAGVWQLADNSISTGTSLPGRMVSSLFYSGRIQLGRGTVGALTGRCYGFRITDCSIASAISAHAFSLGTLTGLGACGVSIDNCDFSYTGDEDCVAIKSALSGSERVANDWSIRNCRFNNIGGATHVAGAGTGTSAGTGWAVNSSPDITAQNDNITIEDCRFTGETVDAGGIRLSHTRNAKVRGCEWYGASHTAGGGDSYTAILVRASALFEARTTITDCVIANWNAGKAHTRGVALTNVNDVKVRGCTIRGDDYLAANITGRGADDSAMVLSSVNNITIEGCEIPEWEPGSAANSRGIVCTVGTCERLIINACRFYQFGGFAIYLAPTTGIGNGPTITGNSFSGNTATGGGIFCNYGTGFFVINGNTINCANAADPAISMDTISPAVCMGNVTDGKILTAGGGTVRGHNEAAQDLNSCSAYT